MSTLLQDLRYALRTLGRSPGFTTVTLVTLALGIGASTAIFTVVNAVLLRPLPYAEPDGLMMVWERRTDGSSERNVVSPANYLDWKDRTASFTALAAFTWSGTTLTGETPERLQGRKVTPEFFSVLGVSPALGRTFSAEEAQPGQGRVVLLSDGLWRRRFSADPGIIGRSIPMTGGGATVVGVMPPSFRPLPWGDEEYWEPFGLSEADRIRRGRYAQVVGRLRPGVSPASASVELSGVAAELAVEHPEFNAGWGANVVSLETQVTGASRTALLTVLGAAGLLLLIACANVANLMLGRATTRRRELAVRLALGAPRWRLTRQWLAEGVLLSLGGGAVGVLLANWGVDLLLAAHPSSIPRLAELTVDGRVLTVTLTVSVLVGILLSLPTLLGGVARPPAPGLRESGRSTAGSAVGRLRSGLVVVQVALALVLLFGAGLLVRSLRQLTAVGPGFDPSNMLTAQLDLPAASYPDATRQTALFGELLEALRASPDVAASGLVSFLPLTGAGAATTFALVGDPPTGAGLKPSADIRVADPGYFDAMRIPLRRGRLPTATDDASAAPVVLINETMARQYWPDADPVGQRLQVDWGPAAAGVEVIGVVGDVHAALDQPSRPMIYYPMAQSPTGGGMMLVVRSREAGTAAAAASVRGILHQLDPNLPLSDVASMYTRLADSTADRRYPMFLLGAFAGLAVALAAIGLYGVLAFAVAERTRELGIRLALGARPADVLGLVVRGGLQLTLVGLLLGGVVAMLGSGLLRTLLYEVPVTDPLTFATVAALMLLVATTACFIPARRAARTDPMVILRSE